MFHSGVRLHHVCSLWTIFARHHGLRSARGHRQLFMPFSCLGNSVIKSWLAHTSMDSLWVSQIVATFHLSFWDANVVDHFYCDDVPLVALACSDTHIKELMLLVTVGFSTLCSLLIVIISYVFILVAILRMHSTAGRQKAFSTCALHLTSITMEHSFLCTCCPSQAILWTEIN